MPAVKLLTCLDQIFKGFGKSGTRRREAWKGENFHKKLVLSMERETRFELATSTLARLHSTTELFPLDVFRNGGRIYRD